jgi:hypothetical protein
MRSNAFVITSVVVCITGSCEARPDAQTFDPNPANIVWDKMLAPVIKDLLMTSDTFRRQWQALAETPRLTVYVRLAIAPEPVHVARGRARAVLSRYEYGHMHADVEMRSMSNMAALLAHELEHVLEWSEGMDYSVLVRKQPSLVWQLPNGEFETRRALDVDARVAREIAASRRASRARR